MLNKMSAREAALIIKGKDWVDPKAFAQTPAWKERLVAFHTVVESARGGGAEEVALLKEAMTADDFPNLLGDSLNRTVRAKYRMASPVWRGIMDVRQVNDYRSIKSHEGNSINGLWTPTGGASGAGADVKNKADKSPTTYTVQDYGAEAHISRQAIINDDLGIFNDIPADLVSGAVNTEMSEFTEQFFSVSGPQNVTAVTGTNPALAVSSLRTAFGQIAAALDPDSGAPISIGAPILMVGPGLYHQAIEIVRATHIENNPGVTSGDSYRTDNWIRSTVTDVVMNPWMPIRLTSNDNTAWVLFAAAQRGSAAGEAAFLRGQTEPSIYIKAQDKMLAGGGLAPMSEGGFADDKIHYKGRHSFAMKAVASIYAYGSNGSAS